MQDYRPVSFHQDCESRLGQFSARSKRLEQLPVRPIPQRPNLEKSVDVAEYRDMMAVCHRFDPSSLLSS
jgi:hypothetical protein